MKYFSFSLKNLFIEFILLAFEQDGEIKIVFLNR